MTSAVGLDHVNTCVHAYAHTQPHTYTHTRVTAAQNRPAAPNPGSWMSDSFSYSLPIKFHLLLLPLPLLLSHNAAFLSASFHTDKEAPLLITTSRTSSMTMFEVPLNEEDLLQKVCSAFFIINTL